VLVKNILGKNTGWFTPDINPNWLVVEHYPSENYGVKVSWDDYSIPNVWKNNPNVPNHQPAKVANHTFHNKHHRYSSAIQTPLRT